MFLTSKRRMTMRKVLENTVGRVLVSGFLGSVVAVPVSVLTLEAVSGSPPSLAAHVVLPVYTGVVSGVLSLYFILQGMYCWRSCKKTEA